MVLPRLPTPVNANMRIANRVRFLGFPLGPTAGSLCSADAFSTQFGGDDQPGPGRSGADTACTRMKLARRHRRAAPGGCRHRAAGRRSWQSCRAGLPAGCAAGFAPGEEPGRDFDEQDIGRRRLRIGPGHDGTPFLQDGSNAEMHTIGIGKCDRFRRCGTCRTAFSSCRPASCRDVCMRCRANRCGFPVPRSSATSSIARSSATHKCR